MKSLQTQLDEFIDEIKSVHCISDARELSNRIRRFYRENGNEIKNDKLKQSGYLELLARLCEWELAEKEAKKISEKQKQTYKELSSFSEQYKEYKAKRDA